MYGGSGSDEKAEPPMLEMMEASSWRTRCSGPTSWSGQVGMHRRTKSLCLLSRDGAAQIYPNVPENPGRCLVGC